MKRIAFLLLLCSVTLKSQVTVTYAESSSPLFNPERGFYHHTEVMSTGAYSFLDQARLQSYRTAENISLILRVFYLNNFLSSDISAAFLDNIQTDFNTARNAGVKVIVRFAYTNTTVGWPPTSPYGDATKERILSHIQQLSPLLSSNADVIATVQAGFIGIWGEWYYTTYLGDPALSGHPDATDYANRKDIVDAYLAALPSDRAIAIRTPLNKTKMLGITTTEYVTAATAFQNTPLARLSHHNDCFLASESDYGTYVDSTNEKPYLNKETLYLPMGGETCNDDATFTNCMNAQKEMKRMHWSYLNRDYNTTVIDRWISNGCYSSIVNGLGYRIVLKEGIYPTVVEQGGNLSFSLSLKNAGWAAPFNARNVIVVARNISTNAEYSYPLNSENPRTWLSQEDHAINATISIGNIPEGSYKLFLHLADPYPGLSTNPHYAIQAANTGTWESSSGYNDLQHTLLVSQPMGIGEANQVVAAEFTEYGVQTVKIINMLGLEVFSAMGNTEEISEGLEHLTLCPGRYQMMILTDKKVISRAYIVVD